MKKTDFDCVEMKHQIQQKILERRKGLSPERAREETEKSILAHPILKEIWKKAKRINPPDPHR